MAKTGFALDDIQTIFNEFRHCKNLGLQVVEAHNKQVIVALPYSDQIIGNPETRVIHGGAITTLLDSTCGMSVPLALGEFFIAPTLDLRIDYMTAAKPDLTIYAKAEAYRITKNIVFTRGIAYQDDESRPVAHCVATFMPLPKAMTDQARNDKALNNKAGQVS